ncbi:MAG TPA: S53 family peptidase [Intrasporangium sp.]|uniref:S53 family peptidase n=1 Tax=Intrasporangium sp. TaxID=1925024 RepID=UPI002F947B8C
MRLLRSIPLVGVAVAALVTGTGGAGLAAGSSGGNTKLPGSLPTWATAVHRVGSANGSQPVGFRVYLRNRDDAGAAAYARAVSTKGNALYGKFLTPAQFRSRFSPTAADVARVETWLRGQGFTIGTVPDNNKYVEAIGTVAKAAKAFNTSFATFRYQGQTMRSNTTALSVPSSLSGIQGVIGLDESANLVHVDASPPAGFRNAPPCSRYWGQKTLANTPTPDGTMLTPGPWSNNAAGTVTAYSVTAFAPCGYAGTQLQGAYGLTSAIDSGNDGTGVTVAVIDAYASSTIVSDVTEYSRRHGLPPITGHFSQVVAPGTYVRPQNPVQDPEGWSGEETLDVEAVHTMAPGADIVYVGAPNNYRDLDAIMNRVVDRHLADIVTNSYGYAGEALPPGYIKPQEDTYIQAAAEGISLFFSSGDSGDETFGDSSATPSPDWPASSPWVTAVGGTSMGVTQGNTRLFELGWQSGTSTWDKKTSTWGPLSYLYGGGGGTSRLFAQPSYQAGVVPNSIATYNGTAPAARVVPDVSALGDPNTGMLVGQTQRFSNGTYYDEYRIGGTSLSSPLYAGMFALAVQNHGSYGLANPALYAARSVSYDVTKTLRSTYPGAIRVNFVNSENADDGYTYLTRTFDWDEPLTIHVRPGYDDVTGVGSPAGSAWLNAVSSYGG